MFTGNEKEKWAYHCLMRPPTPGAVPREGLDYLDFREGTTLSGHHYWGSVIYIRELSQDEVEHYDLDPTALVTLD